MKPHVVSSMIAYLIAQSVDVQLFHFWRRVTKGKHLWLRNNGSMMGSQMIDTITILTILYFAGGLGADIDSIGKLIPLMLSSYAFKVTFAALDTPLFYLGVHLLKDRVAATDELAAVA